MYLVPLGFLHLRSSWRITQGLAGGCIRIILQSAVSRRFVNFSHSSLALVDASSILSLVFQDAHLIAATTRLVLEFAQQAGDIFIMFVYLCTQRLVFSDSKTSANSVGLPLLVGLVFLLLIALFVRCRAGTMDGCLDASLLAY